MNARHGGLRAALAVAFASFWIGAPSFLGWRFRSDVEVLAVLVVGALVLLAWPAVLVQPGQGPRRSGEASVTPGGFDAHAPYEGSGAARATPLWLGPPFWFAVVAPLAALFLTIHSIELADVGGDAAPVGISEGEARQISARLERGVLRPVEVRGTGRASRAGDPLGAEALVQPGHPPLMATFKLLPGESRTTAAWMVGPSEAEAWEESSVAGVRIGAPSGLALGQPSYEAPSWARRGLPGGEGQERSGAGVPGRAFPWAGWLAAVAGAITAVALRRSRLPVAARAGLLVLLGGAVAAAASLLASAGTRMDARGTDGVEQAAGSGTADGVFIEVIEGRRLADNSTEWVRVQRSFGAAILRAGRLVESLSGTFEVPLGATVAETRLSVSEGDPRASVHMGASSDPVDWIAPHAAGLRLLRPDINTWGSFESVWVREGSGAWSALGAWELGDALKEPAPERPTGPSVPRGRDGSSRSASGLPGWCASGLPQGRTVFVGRLAQAANGPTPVWVRLVGFQP